MAAAAVAGIQLVHLDRLHGPSNDFKVLVSLRGTGQDDISMQFASWDFGLPHSFLGNYQNFFFVIQ